TELNGVVSPDGRWLAYQSDSSGQFEIYVSPLQNAGEREWRVSTNGGRQPLWSRSGRELFYVSADGSLMSVAVSAGPTWHAGNATKLLDGRYFTGGGLGGDPGRHYDISLDDTRFLMM